MVTQTALFDWETEPLDPLSALESSIVRQEGEIEDSRKLLRQFLFAEAGIDGSGGSIGDALSELAKQPSQHLTAAIVVLRCLGVQGLMPEPNSTNHIIRSTNALVEGALPEIVSFLKIDTGAQNYQKFSVFSNCHQRIVEILSPLQSPFGDLDALLNARKEIAGCLNHSIVRKYAGPFKLAEVRTTIESLFSKLKKVSSEDTSLLQDIEDCNRVASNVRLELSAEDTFLYREFLAPFLDVCETVLSRFLISLRSRFATDIVWVGASSRELQKRYPLHEPEREIQIVIPLRNLGPGLAADVRISVETMSENVVLGSETIALGNVLPGKFSITLATMVISRCPKFTLDLSVEWGEIGNPNRTTKLFEFDVVAQSSAVDWQSLEYAAPYSTDVAEGDEFVGRADKVSQLAAKFLRHPMEPFYLTGQKRVGKTSLALAAAEFAKSASAPNTLDTLYILWGSVAHADPDQSLQRLGTEIEKFITDRLPQGLRETKGDYLGSLAGLIQLSNAAFQAIPNRRFVIILDEFDEIHQELYLHGNLAETFFGNLRALSRCKNICLVMVGGENMPFIMDRQGQKLNNFSRINLSYFSRETEWSDFQLLASTPTKGTLNWHEDAVSEIFNITNGNPYFAKIVCAGCLRSAVSERDADITANEVQLATAKEISDLGSNSFAHLWQDGVPKAISEREPDILRRMRVLVALARCLRQGKSPTATHIGEHKTSTSLSDGEITAVLHDFVRRDVLIESSGEYEIKLPIFQRWLVDVGASQLIADNLNEELANAALAEENNALVLSDELVALAQSWPTYRGKHIGTDEIREWYQQVENPRDQRILFKLLLRTRVFSEYHVRERLKSAHGMIRPSLPEFVIRRRSDRRKDLLVTYIDGEGKSGSSYASLYAEENGIAANCVTGPDGFLKRFEKHAKEHGTATNIVIMDDIAATGKSLNKNLDRFLTNCGDVLKAASIHVVTLVATDEAQSRILKYLDRLEHLNIDFRSCEILPKEDFAFSENSPGWSSDDELSRAKALCTDLGSRIYQKSPLGFGNLGLLIVFPTTVPNNSLPILHSFARTGSGHSWNPLFPRMVN